MKPHRVFFSFAIVLGSLLGGAGTASEAIAPQQTIRQTAPELQQVAQAQAQRFALVIGNADYKSSPLRNPANDARDMATALQELGFEVNLLLDATLPQIEAAIEQLNRQLRRGGVGMVFYAGHGIQVKGENYLMPIGANINREQDVRYEAYPLGRLLGSLEDADNDLNIVILDACRNNPFARQWRSASMGLAPVQSARGTLVAYATYPGGLADDGPDRNGVY
ncbi:MAG: caspase family protein, partial [Cyanobacteria bacterium J06641_5]